MMSQVDVAIIGAGIVGAACARALAGEGLRVAVYDKDTIGGGTTGAGMGHVVVMDDSEAQFALTAYSRSLWHDLAAAAPPQMEFSGCGTVWVAADDEEMEEVSRKLAFYSERGVAATRLDAHTLYEHEPHLRPGLAGGLLVPDDAVVYPPGGRRLPARSGKRTRGGGPHENSRDPRRRRAYRTGQRHRGPGGACRQCGRLRCSGTSV